MFTNKDYTYLTYIKKLESKIDIAKQSIKAIDYKIKNIEVEEESKKDIDEIRDAFMDLDMYLSND